MSSNSTERSNSKSKRPATRQSNTGVKRALYVAAPQLDRLPHSVTVAIMCLLDVPSRLRLARVCRHFWEIHSDHGIWETADLTQLSSVIDARKIRSLLSRYFPPTLRELRVRHDHQRNRQKAALLTTSFMSLLSEKCCNLTTLYLVDVCLTHLEISDFVAFPSLRHLHLDSCPTKQSFFLPLQNKPHSFPNLREVCLLNCAMVSFFDIKALCSLSPNNIRSLKLKHLYRLNLSSLQPICSQCTDLQELWLEKMMGGSLTVTELVEQGPFPPKLRALSLKDTLKSCSSEDLRLLSTCVPGLRYLDLRGCGLHSDSRESVKDVFPDLLQLLS